MVKGNKILYYIMIVSIILAIVNAVFSRNLTSNIFLFGSIGIGLYFYLWYKYITIKEGAPTYFNPYIVITLLILIMCYVFITGNLCGQTYVISQNITIKQHASINEKVVDLYKINGNLKVSEEFTKLKPFKQSCKNLIGLMFSTVDESLIITERDL